MKIKFFFIAFCIFSCTNLISFVSNGQNYFHYYYTQTPNPTYDSLFQKFTVTAYDGSIIGISDRLENGFPPFTFSIFRMDQLGNMIWRKEIILPGNSSPDKMIYLTDSTVAIKFWVSNLPTLEQYFIIKLGMNGNLIWSRGLSDSGTMNYGAFASAPNGGMVIGGAGCGRTNILIQLDKNGSITNQTSNITVNGCNVCDIVYDGNNFFTCLGYSLGNPGFSAPVIFQSDIYGNILNYLELDEPFEPAYIDGHSLIKVNNGGYYFLANKSRNLSVLCYYNSLLQPVWKKNIFFADTTMRFYPRALTAQSNNGCLLTMDLSSSYLNHVCPQLPAFFKFDSTGSLSWVKVIGDTSLSNWRSIQAYSTEILPDNSMLIFMNREWYFNVWKTDSLMNNFCHYSNFTFEITDVFITESSFGNYTQYNNEAYLDTFQFSLIDDTTYQHSECIDLTASIVDKFYSESFLDLLPNPAQNKFSIQSTLNYSEVMIYNSIGKCVYSGQNSPKEININNYTSGLYQVFLINENMIVSRKKLIIQ